MRIDGDGWKFADGQFRSISNADFTGLALAARTHVRGAFVIEAELIAAIEAGTITTTVEINSSLR